MLLRVEGHRVHRPSNQTLPHCARVAVGIGTLHKIKRGDRRAKFQEDLCGVVVAAEGGLSCNGGGGGGGRRQGGALNADPSSPKGVQPSLSALKMSAFISVESTWMASWWPSDAATDTGVWPSLVAASTSAPSSYSTLSAPTCPPDAAAASGV